MMWMMLQQETPDDYVVATNEAHSVREFVEAAFEHVGVQIKWEVCDLTSWSWTRLYEHIHVQGEGVNEIGKDSKTGVTRVMVCFCVHLP